MQDAIHILGVAHLGIRVAELDRSLEFYQALGFERRLGPFPGQPVVILENAAGVEINLIVNAHQVSEPNILMDVPEKHAGYTHVALKVSDLEQTLQALQRLGLSVSDGPVTFPTGACAVFLRDPDQNVIELHQPPASNNGSGPALPLT